MWQFKPQVWIKTWRRKQSEALMYILTEAKEREGEKNKKKERKTEIFQVAQQF